MATNARKGRPRRARRRITLTVGLLLLLLGTWVGAATVLAPDSVERAWGTVRNVTTRIETRVRHDGVAQVRLGEPGDTADMDACTGSFTEMESYRLEKSLQPTFAAHNSCHGDVILSWSKGTLVDVQPAGGKARRYVVTDTRDIARYGTTTADITGLKGTILLQTCYYGEPRMRFVALTPDGATPATSPAGGSSKVRLDPGR